MDISDIKVGMPIQGFIDKIMQKGALVKITKTIRGFIPKMHASDTGTLKVAKRFKEGQKVSNLYLNGLSV